MIPDRVNNHCLRILSSMLTIVAVLGLDSECRAAFSDQTATLVPQGFGSDGLNGIMWGNVNNDGFVDLVTGSGGYINNDGTNFSDGGPNNSIWADYNNDGFDDVSFGKIFASNAQGNATFFVTDHGDAGGNLFWPGTSHHRAFGDLDNNGFVDLYACGGEGAVNPDNIFLNFGSRYTNAWSGNGGVYSRGVTMCDFDKDGDLDIYVSNYWLAQDNLWVNNGSATFADEAVARGINNAGHGLGADWCDLDNDGDFDLAMANLDHGGQPPTAFWRNSGPPNYTFVNGFTAPYVERYASPAAGDYDNDGDLDVYIGDLDGGPRLLRNDGGFSFTDVTGAQGIPAQVGTGVGWADYDNDGDLDLATPTKILRNDLVHGAGTHWLKVKLVGDGVQVNKSAIGTQCFIDLGGGTILSRQVSTSAGERNSKVHTLHYGLGTQTTPVDLDICWPGGITSSVSNVSVDQLVTINFVTTTSTTSTSTLTSSTSSTTTSTTSTSSSTTLTNVPPYEEPFEEYADGISLHSTNGWNGEVGAATISTDATWINRLTDYINSGLGYPLPSEAHTKIMCVAEAQSISNRIASASATVFTDFLWLQASGPNPPQAGKAPPADASDQLALYVENDGKLTIWHDDSGVGTGNEYLKLAASPVIATGAWTRITIEQNYTGNRYRVRVNQGAVIQDAKGWDAPVGGSQPGTWFNMVKKNGSMSRFVATAFNGDAYVDDLQVKLTTPLTTTSTTTSTTTFSTTTSTSSTSTVSTTSSTSTNTTTTTSTTTTTFANVVPYEEPFEEYADGLSIAGTNGWFGIVDAATISTDTTLIGLLTAYTNSGLSFPIPSATHDKILCVNNTQSISNKITTANTTVFTDFLWVPQLQGGIPPPASANDQMVMYVNGSGRLTIWHDDSGVGTGNEFLALAAAPLIGTGAWTRITIEQNYTGNRYRVMVNEDTAGVSDTKGWDAPVGGSQPGPWFNMVKKNGSMSRFAAAATSGQAYIDDLQVELTNPIGPQTTTTTSTTTTSTTTTPTTSSTTTSSTTTTSTTSTTTIFTTSTSSTTSPFTGSHDVSYTYTGGYFSFELGDIDPGLAFGHGFLTPGSGDGARFDFWFAPDGVIDGSGVDGGGGATPGGNYAAGGDDVFMGSRVVNEDGVDQYMGGAGLDIDSFAATGSALTNFTGPGFADGTVAAYGRVFENDNPQAGDWYSVGASEVIRNQDVPANPPNTISIGRSLGLGGLDPIDGTQWSFVISATVPPPVIVDVNTDVTLWAVYTPTGTVTPMYSTNLGTVPIEWVTVPVFSNTFVTGTNVITFDPPDTNSADVHFHLLQTF